MDDKHLRRVANLAILASVLVTLLVLAATAFLNLKLDRVSESLANYPKVIQGKDAVVDYDHIKEIVEQEVADIPKPKDGVNGLNGKDGKQGEKGEPGQTGAPGEKGDTGSQGVQGEPGTNGREIELRLHPITNLLQWRYTDSVFWTTL